MMFQSTPRVFGVYKRGASSLGVFWRGCRSVFSQTLLLVAVIGALCPWRAALAGGFVDERASAVAATTPAARSGGKVTGDFGAPEWQQVVPTSGDKGATLPLAVMRLLPLNRPAVTIDAPADLMDMLVVWGDGLTRRQALEQIAMKHALDIALQARQVVIKRSETKPAAPASVAQKNVPVDSGEKLFDVRLSDIKISVAMNRWAQDNGVRIRWDADKHVLVGAPQTFRAKSVFDAVTQALSTPGIKNSDYPLEVCEYPNQPPLLRITRQGDQSKDCQAVEGSGR